MATKLFPIVQFKKDTWEIDEFDCMSMFLLIGTERAMLIDCGMGVGDIQGAVRQITDLPLDVVITHGHGDHIGGAWQFPELWIHRKDMDKIRYFTAEERRNYPKSIALRQHGCLPAAYSMFNLYGYDLDKDIVEFDKDKQPVVHEIVDGQRFDLGGGRIVTAYECPGHTAGQLMFLDEATRTLFVGDALNYNLGVRTTPVETVKRSLQRMVDLSDKYDDIFNGHHDFRGLGVPLGDDCLPNAIKICDDILSGHYNLVTVPNFSGMGRPAANMVLRGRNFMGINPELIFDKDAE